MASPVKLLRTVVWSTGGVGTIAVDAIRRRPDLELVGVWVHSPDKDGRDVGELAGGGAIGLTATNDVDALLALRPDCVVYAANGPERDAAAVRRRCDERGKSKRTYTELTMIVQLRADAENLWFALVWQTGSGSLDDLAASH